VAIPLTPRPRGRRGAAGEAWGSVLAAAPPDADQEVTALYRAQYRSVVRLAVLLVGDVTAAEEVAQDSFIAMHGAWRRLQDRDKALSYLHQSVVSRSRSILHRRGAGPPPERTPVISALHGLPPRQREALVLRFYLDLPAEQVASVMGISQAAVTRYTARAMAALSSVLTLAG
jgi:DNA-directed RNA polymerase specialized sigma24 family protein